MGRGKEICVEERKREGIRERMVFEYKEKEER